MLILINKDEVLILSNIVIAFSTFVGVGAAIAYYLKEIIKDNPLFIILAESIYSILIITLLTIVKRSIK